MSKSHSRILVLILFTSVTIWNFTPIEGERILAFTSLGSRSHWNLMKGILRALTDRGHHVTVFTPFPEGNRVNYTEIDLSKEIIPLEHLDIEFVHKLVNRFDIIKSIHNSSRNTCKMMYKNNALQHIIGDTKTKFDVVFIELRASECMSYLSAQLNLPLVYITPPPLISYVEFSILGHFPNPSVVSNTLADYSVPRTFMERLTNTMISVYYLFSLQYNVWFASKVDTQPFDLVVPIKPSIVFSNAHYITDAPRPLPPNVIHIGGIHLNPPQKIPEDILEFMNDSPQGVIVFTLGSVVAISSLPENTIKTIIEVLGQVPQSVLLKYEGETKYDFPKNIKIRKWFPQRDILVHHNVKLFISHGGIAGIYEAVDAGVPVLGFPIVFDQRRNLENLVDAGMAIVMNLKSICKQTFKKAVSELINNEKYMQNAKVASDRFKDRPMSPAEMVDYWTRYVIRHKGAPILKSHSMNLTWYQYFLLDVIIITILTVIFISYITRKCYKTTRKYINMSNAIK